MAKFTVTFKDPDGVYESLNQAVGAVLEAEGTPKHRREQLKDGVREELSDFAGQWIEYSEYLVVEFDTEAKTATVVPNR